MSHTIELRKVSKYYAGEDSVSMGFSRIDLDLDIGEFVAITGESGSGKSTLLNVISGLDTYEEGEMFVCGEDTTAYNTEDYEVYRKTYIGNIFQDFNLINSYTVYQNIEVVMLLAGRKKKECRSRVLQLIKLVGLGRYCNTKVSKLSGGQKQRVAIARALAKDAPIIVADEPTGNLDSASAESVMETLARVSGDKLVVIVTHNYEQAEPYVTRKITMHDGRIIEDKKIAAAAEEASADDYLDNAGAEALYTEFEAEASAASGDTAPAEEIEELNEEAGDEAAAEPKRVGRAGRMGNRSVRANAGKPKGMRRGSEIMLGMRNTFNIPAKFILLFIVYFFVSTAVLGQYATTKNSMHESELLGSNPYFINATSDRVVIKKKDESGFTEKDFKKIQKTENIREIVKNDYALDSGVSFELNDYLVEGTVMPQDRIKKSDLAYGHMPEDEYEIILEVDMVDDIMMNMMSDEGEAYEEFIDKAVQLQGADQPQRYVFGSPIRIAGIIVKEDVDEYEELGGFGDSTIYVSDEVNDQLVAMTMAAASRSELIFDKKRIRIENQRTIYFSKNIPEGEAYIMEDQTRYYSDEDAVGKKVGIRIDNRFFESEGEYKVAKVITADNCKKSLGIPKDEYNSYYNCVFISEEDFKALFDKGYYQISAFLDNEQRSDETLKEIRDMGFTTLALKDSLTDTTGGYGVVVNGMTYARLALEFIILFFIAYAVIKLIMRSRNSYFSTLRMLGATKRNTSGILRVELILMMIIAYGVDMVFVLLSLNGVIAVKEINKLLFYLTPVDYAALAAVLLLMSLLIANRYSRSIFTRSAMKAFREEA